MPFAPEKITAKLGERRLQSSEDQSSLQQQRQQGQDIGKIRTREYAEAALTRQGHKPRIALLNYDSVIKMVEYLRHRNPDCARTIDGYIGFLGMTLRVLKDTTPDDLVRVAKEADEDQLEVLFLELDDHWLGELNSTATRSTKWAAIKTFLVANTVRKARLLKCNIRNRQQTIDFALTKDDCRKVLEEARETSDKLIVSLLIESLQRIGTINLLTWGDMQPHLEKSEDLFLVWIDPKRTKRNIGHWAPVGPLSTYYMRKRLGELRAKGLEVNSETRLVTGERRPLEPIRTPTIMMQVHRLMMQAGILGRKQSEGKSTRYEKHVHSFRKFGVVEMQRHGVNEQVIRFLMGQKRDTYSNWTNRADELLEIYREARPTLDQKDALADIVEYANSRGYNLDPKYLQVREIKAHSNPHPNNSSGAEATAAFSYSQKSIDKCF